MVKFCIGSKGLCPKSGKSLVIFSLNKDLNWSFSTFAISFEPEINLPSTLSSPTPEGSFFDALNHGPEFLASFV